MSEPCGTQRERYQGRDMLRKLVTFIQLRCSYDDHYDECIWCGRERGWRAAERARRRRVVAEDMRRMSLAV